MSGKRILIVDDDNDLAQGLTIRLRANGYDVAVAPDGYFAVAVARTKRPDLILLDLGLPVVDGHEVIERLRETEEAAHTPIIVLSARNPSEHRDRALKAGAVAYFLKPADNDELLAAIRGALGEPVEQTLNQAQAP